MSRSSQNHHALPGTLLPRGPSVRPRSSARRRPAFSLTELMLVVAVTGIFIAMSVPSFRRGIEQAKADVAAANLRAIWTAQRFYWLEYRTYTDDLAELEALDLVDPTIVRATEPYRYEIELADANAYSVVAVRSGSRTWSGRLSIDETGAIRGQITGRDRQIIQPGFL